MQIKEIIPQHKVDDGAGDETALWHLGGSLLIFSAQNEFCATKGLRRHYVFCGASFSSRREMKFRALGRS
jgi:hypothetical protein